MTRKQPRMQGSRPPKKLVLIVKLLILSTFSVCIAQFLVRRTDDHINLSNEVVEVDKAGAEIKHSEKAEAGCPVSSLTS